MLNKQSLNDFETDIEITYKTGAIRGPIHLRDGNENQLIRIFEQKGICKEDYVFSTWANHLHALLKGIPKDKIKARILEGESMAMNFPEYNFYTSAIVGGICPIAVGVAASLQKKKSTNRVYVFIGDMALLTGIASECIRYSIGYDLPITWIIEDNRKSVDTPTDMAWRNPSMQWGTNAWKAYLTFKSGLNLNSKTELEYYSFESKYPHSGTGTFLAF